MKRLSFTKISVAQQCLRKFYYTYIEKIRSDTKSDALAIGQGVDDFLNKFVYDPNLSIEKAISIYREGCLREGKLENIKSMELYEKMVEGYVRYVKPLKPYEVQKRFRFDCGEGVTLEGIIDIVTEKKGEPYAIVDNKTSQTPYGQKDIDDAMTGKGLQLTIYHAASKELYGKYLPVVGFNVLIKDSSLWNSDRFVQKIIPSKPRSEKQVNRLKQYVVRLSKNIELAHDYPKRMTRSCSWCDYKNICKGD